MSEVEMDVDGTVEIVEMPRICLLGVASLDDCGEVGDPWKMITSKIRGEPLFLYVDSLAAGGGSSSEECRETAVKAWRTIIRGVKECRLDMHYCTMSYPHRFAVDPDPFAFLLIVGESKEARCGSNS